MKKTYILIALAIVAALSIVSCKNNKKAKEPTQEEVQEMKQALADSVLAQIDALASEYITAYENGVRLRAFELTGTEKLVKPDFLLDPKEASTFVTKSQKVNALAFYIVDYGVRMIYGMPLEEAKEAIVKLAVDVNFPFDTDQYEANAPLSERIKAEYEECKERGELAYFWQFQYAIIAETDYIISHNVDLFFSQITEDQWLSFYQNLEADRAAIEILAEYDADMSAFKDFIDKTRVTSSDKEKEDILTSIETSKQFFAANREKQYAIRNALLQ